MKDNLQEDNKTNDNASCFVTIIYLIGGAVVLCLGISALFQL